MMTLFSVKYKIENAMNSAQCRQGDEFELEVPGPTARFHSVHALVGVLPVALTQYLLEYTFLVK